MLFEYFYGIFTIFMRFVIWPNSVVARGCKVSRLLDCWMPYLEDPFFHPPISFGHLSSLFSFPDSSSASQVLTLLSSQKFTSQKRLDIHFLWKRLLDAAFWGYWLMQMVFERRWMQSSETVSNVEHVG